MDEQPDSPQLHPDVARAMDQHGPQGAWWTVHRIDQVNKSEALVDRVYGIDFDEWEVGRRIGPGHYRRRLRVKGGQRHIEQIDFSIGEVVIDAGRVAVPNAGAAPAADAVLERLAAMESRFARAIEGLGGGVAGPARQDVIGVVKEIAGVVGVLAPLFRRDATPLMDTLQGIKMVRDLAREEGGGGGGGTDWGPVVRAALQAAEKFMEQQRRAEAARVRVVSERSVPKLRDIPPMRGREEGPPASAPDAGGPAEGLAALCTMLLFAAGRESEPEPYAVLVADALEAAGIDPETVGAGTGALVDLIVAQRPDLERAKPFLARVDQALAELLATPAEDPAGEGGL